MAVAVAATGSWAWQRLRLLRVNPPGLAGPCEARRRVLTAALEQAEQLISSAAAAPSATRPLPLFYALSQASRAVVAAYGSEPWTIKSHGLEWPGAAGRGTLLERTVKPARRAPQGAFQQLAAATSSAPLSSAVELGALWRALPDLARPPLPDPRSDWRPALLVVHDDESADPWLLSNRLRAHMVGLEAASTKAVADELEHYPTARGGQGQTFPGADGAVMSRQTSAGLAPRVVWEIDGAGGLDNRKQALQRIAPRYRGGNHHAIPALPSGDHLTPLMLWWALLFGLSNLARYEPDTWTAALTVNDSPLTVPIEAALDQALVSVPHLVLEALLAQPVEPGTF